VSYDVMLHQTGQSKQVLISKILQLGEANMLGVVR